MIKQRRKDSDPGHIKDKKNTDSLRVLMQEPVPFLVARYRVPCSYSTYRDPKKVDFSMFFFRRRCIHVIQSGKQRSYSSQPEEHYYFL